MYINHHTPEVEIAADSASNARSWRSFADPINANWGKGAGSFITCGQLLVEAREELARDAFTVMVKTRLAFDASVGRKLMLIASNPLLCAHVHKLPPCWSTLYELSQLEEGVLKSALDSGRVHPGMGRKHAIELKPSKPKKPKTETETEASNFLAAWKAASPRSASTLL